MLVIKPDACAKICSNNLVTLNSWIVGLMKTAASSAYKEILKLVHLGSICCSRPLFCANWNIFWSGSMANKNSMGERGSPCLTPRQCKILLPGSPFSKNEEDDVHHKAETQSHHLLPNPRCCMMSNRYGQLTVSKTLEISNLMNKEGFFSCAIH